MNGITGPVKVKKIFGTVTLNLVLCLGMSWQKTVVAWRTTILSPSVVNENAEMLQPLLVADTYCPTSCPKSPGVRLAAMAPIRCWSQCHRCRRSRWMLRLLRLPLRLLPCAESTSDDAAVCRCNAREYRFFWLWWVTSATRPIHRHSAEVSASSQRIWESPEESWWNYVGWNAPTWTMVGWPLWRSQHHW